MNIWKTKSIVFHANKRDRTSRIRSSRWYRTVGVQKLNMYRSSKIDRATQKEANLFVDRNMEAGWESSSMTCMLGYV